MTCYYVMGPVPEAAKKDVYMQALPRILLEQKLFKGLLKRTLKTDI